MKALEIYQQDRVDREAGNPLPRQQYYAALRDALHRELMQQGYSDLLEQLLLEMRGGELERIYVVDYAALMECHSMIVLGRRMRDATDYVPHLHLRGEKAMWEAVEKPGTFLMSVSRDTAEKLKQLRAVSRQLVDARDDTVIPLANDAAQREIDQVHTLNKMLDERCKALEEEREALQARIRFLEEGVITEQVRYAIEARRIQEEEALRQSYEIQREAAKNAFRSQFAEEQEDARRRLEEEERQLSGLQAEAAKEYSAVRQSMAADLRQMTALLEEKVNAWESSLDRTECRMLAKTYVALHDLLTQGMARLILDAQCAGTDAAVMASLAQMQGQLRDRVHQLEQAMARLGLTVIRPEQGEAFDSAYHVAVGASAGTAGGALVGRCVHPGVKVQVAQGAILRAEVELK